MRSAALHQHETPSVKVKNVTAARADGPRGCMFLPNWEWTEGLGQPSVYEENRALR